MLKNAFGILRKTSSEDLAQLNDTIHCCVLLFNFVFAVEHNMFVDLYCPRDQADLDARQYEQQDDDLGYEYITPTGKFCIQLTSHKLYSIANLSKPVLWTNYTHRQNRATRHHRRSPIACLKPHPMF